MVVMTTDRVEILGAEMYLLVSDVLKRMHAV